jgi:hypothetical protein
VQANRGDSLAQLRLGRQSLVWGLVAGVLFLGASWVTLSLNSGTVPYSLNSRFGGYWALLLPVLAALVLSVGLLVEKWSSYAIWPWEGHFIANVAAVALSVLLLAFLVLQATTTNGSVLAFLAPAVYPAVLAATTTAVAGMALTWRNWATPKIASLVLALIPFAAFFVIEASLRPYSFWLTLTVSFSTAAFGYLASGAELHLMASSGSVQDRQVIAGSQSKLFQVHEELRRMARDLTAREQLVVHREETLKGAESAVEGHYRLLEDRKGDLDRASEDLTRRHGELDALEEEAIRRKGELESHAVGLKSERESLEAREREHALTSGKLEEERRTLAARNAELHQLDADLNSRRTELSRKESDLRALESQLAERAKSAPLPPAAVPALVPPLPGTPGAPSPSSPAPLPDPGRAAVSLGRDPQERERLLAERERQIKSREESLARRREELSGTAVEAQARDRALAGREARLQTQEAELKARQDALERSAEKTRGLEAQLVETEKGSASARAALELRLRQAEEREQTARRRAEELSRMDLEIQKREGTLLARESQYQSQLRTLEGSLEELRRSRSPVGAAELAASLPGAPAPPSASGSREEPALPPASRSNREASGLRRMDDLLKGGYPRGGQVAVIGPAFSGKEALLGGFLAEGLSRGQRVIALTAERTPKELEKELLGGRSAAGIVWLDATGRSSGSPATSPGASGIAGPGDHRGILQAVARAFGPTSAPAPSTRLVIAGLSPMITQSEEREGLAFLRNLIGMLRPRGVTALYSVDRGVHPEEVVESVLSAMDGGVLLRVEGGKNALSIVGLGEVETRQWVEYSIGPGGITLGSFALERIR